MAFAKRLIVFLFIILILAVLSIYWPQLTGKSITNLSPTEYTRETALVTRVVDGDTIHVNINGTDETIRLLGINTPEKGKPYSSGATSFLRQDIENKTIELLRDKEDVDRYKRKLRYAFYDNRLINVEILEKGFATSFMLEGLNFKDKLDIAEEFAQKNEIGLWKKVVMFVLIALNLLI